MKDSISKNLEFKTFIFVTLLGAWIWLIKYYLSLIPLSGDGYLPIATIICSYIIFYPLIPLGMMLVYSSIYQIEDKKEKITEIEKSYKNNAVQFFSWWPINIIMAPAFLIIAIFRDWPIYLTVFMAFLFVFTIREIFFKKIYTWIDIKTHYATFSKSFFLYLIIFVSLIVLLVFSYK
jgi:hypothetical protein